MLVRQICKAVAGGYGTLALRHEAENKPLKAGNPFSSFNVRALNILRLHGEGDKNTAGVLDINDQNDLGSSCTWELCIQRTSLLRLRGRSTQDHQFSGFVD